MMNKSEILTALNQIFCDVFDDETLNITAETTSADIEDWDSLEHINLIVACEKKFNIKFNIQEVTQMKNVGDMVSLIQEKLS